MKPLELQSERYSALGNLASEGVQNQLGRPRLDPMTVLIRESVQNSWDAHDPADPHIRYEVDLYRATRPQLDALADVAFRDTPANMSIAARLREAREDASTDLHLLVLSDRLTSGLAGPTRADMLIEEEGEQNDFVDFLRNIGQPPDKPLGGGTYGYGKAALYAISKHRTILVYTRCRYRGRSERRLFVAGLGMGFTHREGDAKGRYTGRHWWGRIRDGVVEPLLDDDAQSVARSIGIPDFADGEHGTSIAILDAELGPRKAREAIGLMQEALLWSFWPKMVAGEDGRSAIAFAFRLDGKEVPLPDPMNHPPLEGFMQAMEHLKAVRSGRASRHFGSFNEIWCQNPKKLLGWLSLYRFEVRRRKTLVQGDAATGALGATCNHVALMRDAELVVRYLEGVPLQTDRFEYAGVFIASRELDRAFAESEPPTHDDWVWENLDDKNHRTFVKVALRNIREQMKDYAQPTGSSRKGGRLELPLGGLSSSLGNLLTGLGGLGANRPKLDDKAEVVPSGPVIEDLDEVRSPEPELFPLDDDTTEEVDRVHPDPHRPELTDEHPKAGLVAAAPEPAPQEVSSPPPKAPADAPRPERPRPAPGAAKVTTTSPRLAVVADRGVLELDLKIQHGRNSDGSLVTARVSAELDGQALETSPPEGAEVPHVLHWRSSDGRISGAGEDTLFVRVGDPSSWTLVVGLVEDVSVRASIEVESRQDAS